VPNPDTPADISIGCIDGQVHDKPCHTNSTTMEENASSVSSASSRRELSNTPSHNCQGICSFRPASDGPFTTICARQTPFEQEDVTTLLSRSSTEARLKKEDQELLTAPITIAEIDFCFKHRKYSVWMAFPLNSASSYSKSMGVTLLETVIGSASRTSCGIRSYCLESY